MKLHTFFKLAFFTFFISILLGACTKKAYEIAKEGDNLYKKEELAHAIDKYEKAIKQGARRRTLKNPGRVYYRLAESYRKMNRPHEMASPYKRAFEAGYNKDSKWIITDVRFKNEADRIKKEGGYLIRINRPLKLRFPRLFSSYKESGINSGNFENYIKDNHNKLFRSLIHQSETNLDFYRGFHSIIDNDTNDVENLINNLKAIVL